MTELEVNGQRRSVVILWTWTALLSGLVLYPVYTSSDDGALPIGIAALALLLYTVLHPRARTERRARKQAAPVESQRPGR